MNNTKTNYLILIKIRHHNIQINYHHSDNNKFKDGIILIEY
jgi:hypothetical protein